MEQNNNQAEVAETAINTPTVEMAAPAAEALVPIPTPKVVNHLSEMVEQHAKRREAIRQNMVASMQRQQKVDGAAPAAVQEEQNVESNTNENELNAGKVAEDVSTESNPEAADVSENEASSSVNDNQLKPNRADKRIGKLTARAKTAEEQLSETLKQTEELRKEVEKLKIQPKQEIPYQREITAEEEKSWGEYARETDLVKLQAEHKKLKNFLDDIQDTLDIGAVKHDQDGKEYLMEVGGQKLDKSQLVAIKRDLKKRVEEAIPSRFQALNESRTYKQRADSFIDQWVPEARDENSDVYKELQVAKQSRFGHVFNEIPQAELIWALGTKAVSEMLKKNGSTTTASLPKVSSKAPRPVPSPVLQRTAGPASTGETGPTADKIAQYQRLVARARYSQSDTDMAIANAFKKQNKL